jgi:hypothetical protein
METKVVPGLGDTVRLNWADGYADGTVSHIHPDGTIDVFRPYTHHSGVSYAGREGSSRVICYVGIEECKNMNPYMVTVLKKSLPLR